MGSGVAATHMFKKAIIALAIAAFVFVILANFVRARSTSSCAACINNLRQFESAKQQWMLENRKTTNDVMTLEDARPYLGRGTNGVLPVCPSGGTYILGRIGETTRCSLGGPQHTLQ